MLVKTPSVDGWEIGRPVHRLSNPVQSGVLYQFRQPLFSYYGVKAGSALSLQLLFTIPKGQQYTPTGGTATALTLWATNMTQASLLPNPQKFYARFISLAVREDVFAQDLIRFLDDTIVSLNISSRSFLDIHARKVPGAGGPFGATSAILGNGFPGVDNELELSSALGEIIEQGQSFYLQLDPTQVSDAAGNGVYTANSSGTGINCKAYIDGLLNREVL